MEKDWFVFVGDHHRGPFSADEIIRLYVLDKISAETLVWKQGDKQDWKALNTCDAFATLFPQVKSGPEEELPVDQPATSEEPEQITETEEIEQLEIPEGSTPEESLPVEVVNEPKVAEVVEETVEEAIEEVTEVEEVPGPAHLPEVPTEKDKELLERFSFLGHLNVSSETEMEMPKRGAFPKVLISLSVVILILTVAIFWGGTDPKRIINVTKKDLQRLGKVIEMDYAKKGLQLELALTKDGSSLWASINRPGAGDLYITMTSQKDKVFADEDISIGSKSTFEKHYAKFHKLKIIKGKKIASGYYKVALHGVDTSLKGKITSFVKNMKFLNFIESIKNYQPKFQYQGVFLLSKDSKKRFEEKLVNFKKKSRGRSFAKIQGMIESYRTYIAILGQLESLYERTLRWSRKKEFIALFEKHYMKKISPIFELVILENTQESKEDIVSELKMEDEYQRLISWGKSFGFLATDMLRPPKVKNPHEVFAKKVQLLRDLATSRIAALQQSLEL